MNYADSSLPPEGVPQKPPASDREKSGFLKNWGIYLIFTIGLIALSAIMALSAVNEREFADGELNNWIQTVGTFKDIWLIDSDLTRSSGDSRSYRVTYGYRIEIETDEGALTLESAMSNTGTTVYNQIPEDAYIFYQPGETKELVYNPQNPDDFRLVSKDDYLASAKSPAGMIFAAGFALAGLGMLIHFIRSMTRRKKSFPEDAKA